MQARTSARWWLPYLLWDPEVHTYSYDVVVSAEYLDSIADVLGISSGSGLPIGEAQQVLAQVHAELPTLTRGHPESKRQPPLGRHLTGCLVILTTRPTQVIEVGVHHGVGTLVFHEALARVGSSDERSLNSIDINPENAWLPKSAGLRSWEFQLGDAGDLVSGIKPVGIGPVFAVLDATPDSASTQAQVDAVMSVSKGRRCVLLGNSEWNSVIRDTADRYGGAHVTLQETPVRHWSSGRSIDLASIPAL
jgi:hypothetical protein